MDGILTDRWQHGQTPFDGECLRLVKELPLGQIRAPLFTIVEQLQRRFERRQLFRVRDWRQHDGYVDSAESYSWLELANVVSSDGALMAAMPGDHAVRLAIYPAQCDFLFRCYMDTDELCEENQCGDFDLCGPAELLHEVKDALACLRNGVALELVCEPAKAYFDRVYAG